MLNLKIRTLRKYNHKIIAFGCALIWWHIAHYIYPDTIWVDIPVYVYNQQEHNLSYPATVKVLLQMNRIHFYLRDFEDYSAHIDGTVVNEHFMLKKEHIIVPSGVKIVDYYPKVFSFYKNK
jgi:hypothetical protein